MCLVLLYSLKSLWKNWVAFGLRNWKIPRHERGHDAKRLLDGKDTAAGDSRGKRSPLDALGLAGEPTCEGRGVLDLAVGLG